MSELKATLESRVRENRPHGSEGGGAKAHPDVYYDLCRIRKANAPANFVTVKHVASNLLRQAPGKDSLRVKRRLVAWDDDYLAQLVTRQIRSPDSPAHRPKPSP
jgi:hypothetical protein